MAHNIILADPQEFTASANNELYFQGWKTDVPGPVKVYHVVGEADPASVDMNITIEDVFVTQPAGKYSQFYITPRVFDFVGRAEDREIIFTYAGDMANVLYPGMELNANNLNQLYQHLFQNFSLLAPNQYSWRLRFGVHGRRADSGSIEQYITELNILFTLDILSENQILSVPDHMHLPHIKGEAPLPGQQMEIVTGQNFQISIPSYFELTGGNVVPTTVTPTHQRYSGSGRQTLTMKVKPEFDLYEGNIYSSYMELRTFDAPGLERRVIFSGQVTGYLFDAHGFKVSPDALEFLSIKSLENPVPQDLLVISTQVFTVEHPYWLQVSPLAGGTYQKLSVQPINSINLQPGDYLGFITLTSAAASIEVPVTLRVVESIDEGFAPNFLNFTHQNKDFSYLYSDVSGERGSAVLNVSTFDFKGFSTATSHSFKTTFFNSKTEIHIGEIVARRFKKLSSPAEIGYRNYNLEENPVLFRIFSYYKPASVDVSLSIENRESGEISKTKDFRSVLFVSGRKPKQFQDDYGILNYESVPVRVTSKSQALFNFVRRSLNHEIKIYRNEAIYKTVSHSPGNNILFGMAMFFQDFTPGDVIGIRLYQNDESFFEQKYLMFPDGDYSNHIAFMNENNVLESYEFTGALTFNSDYESTSFKSYGQLVEYLENLEMKKEQTLIINSGWILKSNSVIMDAITRAKRVWFINGGQEISLTPIAKKLVNEDSQKELYEYDLEFKINLENDLEVYGK